MNKGDLVSSLAYPDWIGVIMATHQSVEEVTVKWLHRKSTKGHREIETYYFSQLSVRQKAAQ